MPAGRSPLGGSWCACGFHDGPHVKYRGSLIAVRVEVPDALALLCVYVFVCLCAAALAGSPRDVLFFLSFFSCAFRLLAQDLCEQAPEPSTNQAMATPKSSSSNRQKGRQEVAPQAEADVECLHQPLAQVDQQPYVDVRSDNEDCELVRERPL
ncbi:hypothetical protein TcBrA4_0042410 [Trypanosoma cruzi]|nr:hypothetical protein TcBrA4_0042410 [Trypanosoma cruzi]